VKGQCRCKNKWIYTNYKQFCWGNSEGSVLTTGRTLGKSRGNFAGNRGKKLALF